MPSRIGAATAPPPQPPAAPPAKLWLVALFDYFDHIDPEAARSRPLRPLLHFVYFLALLVTCVAGAIVWWEKSGRRLRRSSPAFAEIGAATDLCTASSNGGMRSGPTEHEAELGSSLAVNPRPSAPPPAHEARDSGNREAGTASATRLCRL